MTHQMTVGELRELISRLDEHDRIRTSEGFIDSLDKEDDGGRIFHILQLDDSEKKKLEGEFEDLQDENSTLKTRLETAKKITCGIGGKTTTEIIRELEEFFLQ